MSDPVVAFMQEFQKNAEQFCASLTSNSCDGAYDDGGGAQDCGTIDRRVAPWSQQDAMTDGGTEEK